jgi:hypothetical protein
VVDIEGLWPQIELVEGLWPLMLVHFSVKQSGFTFNITNFEGDFTYHHPHITNFEGDFTYQHHSLQGQME